MPKLSPRAAPVSPARRSPSPSKSSSSSGPRRLTGLLVAVGTSVAVALVSLSSSSAPDGSGLPPLGGSGPAAIERSSAARAAEADTRALLDERTALHLHKLRL